MNRRELRRLAQAATPGPWKSDSCGDVWTEAEKELCPGMDQELFRMIGTTKRGPDRGDAAFIAALNPTQALALLDALRTAEQAIEHATKFYGTTLMEPGKEPLYKSTDTLLQEALAAIRTAVGEDE